MLCIPINYETEKHQLGYRGDETLGQPVCAMELTTTRPIGSRRLDQWAYNNLVSDGIAFITNSTNGNLTFFMPQAQTYG